MVVAFIFLAHIIFTVFVFFKRRQKDSLSSGIIDVIFIIIIFSVGWSLSTMVSKIFWEPTGFGEHFDRDAISLTLLTIAEFLFFRVYFKDLFTTEAGKEK